MTCEKIKKELVAYRHGELAERERAWVVDHLRTCPSCIREDAQLAHVNQLLTNLERITPSPGFAMAFQRRLAQEGQLEQESGESRLIQWWREWLSSWQLAPALAGAASLLVFLGYLLSGNLPIEQQAPLAPGIPGQVAQQSDPSMTDAAAEAIERPELFVDYRAIADLDRLAHFDEVASTESAPEPEPAVAREEELPPELRQDPSFFASYPILQRMEQLENMDAVLSVSSGSEEQHKG